MSRETDIALALYEAVANLAGSVKVQYPGISGSGERLEVVHIRNNRNNEYWDKSRTYQGILRVLYRFENDSSGSIPRVEYLEGLAEQLPKGTTLIKNSASVVIYDNPDVGDTIVDEEGGGLFIPLTFLYRDWAPA